MLHICGSRPSSSVEVTGQMMVNLPHQIRLPVIDREIWEML